MLQKIKKFIRNFFLIDDSPHKVAAGAALGIFSGTLPGIGIMTSLVVATLFRFNRLAATTGFLATNLWVTVVTLPLAAAIGGFIFGIDSQHLIDTFKMSYEAGFSYFFSEILFFQIFLPLMVGFLLISLAVSFSVYFLFLYLLNNKKIRFKKTADKKTR